MKKLFAALFVFAFSLMAADFWAKPYTGWSHNDLVKMVTNSPWARTFSVSLPAGAGNPGGAPSAGGGRGRGPAGDAGGGFGGPGGPPVNIYARWQSALPVRQALARLKFGADTATSPDAKKLLEREATDYMIVVSGPLRSLPHDDTETVKKAIMDASLLSAQGKDVKPSEVQIGMDTVSYDIVFHFPRSAAFTLDDKEAEFSTKYGDVTLKSKFKLKEMVYNGKLDM
jgi:hypothetical protein